jgi:hypothetical protein
MTLFTLEQEAPAADLSAVSSAKLSFDSSSHDVETHLRRLEFRLIVLSLIQGQGRTYLNRLERCQLEDIYHGLEAALKAFKQQAPKYATPPSKRTTERKPPARSLEFTQINRTLIRFRGALQKLEAEPCDQNAQAILQESGQSLIPMIRSQLTPQHAITA